MLLQGININFSQFVERVFISLKYIYIILFLVKRELIFIIMLLFRDCNLQNIVTSFLFLITYLNIMIF